MSCIRENIFYPYRHSIRLFDYQLPTVGEMMCFRYMEEQKKLGRKCDPHYVFTQMRGFLTWWKKKNRVY